MAHAKMVIDNKDLKFKPCKEEDAIRALANDRETDIMFYPNQNLIILRYIKTSNEKYIDKRILNLIPTIELLERIYLKYLDGDDDISKMALKFALMTGHRRLWAKYQHSKFAGEVMAEMLSENG